MELNLWIKIILSKNCFIYLFPLLGTIRLCSGSSSAKDYHDNGNDYGCHAHLPQGKIELNAVSSVAPQ